MGPSEGLGGAVEASPEEGGAGAAVSAIAEGHMLRNMRMCGGGRAL